MRSSLPELNVFLHHDGNHPHAGKGEEERRLPYSSFRLIIGFSKFLTPASDLQEPLLTSLTVPWPSSRPYSLAQTFFRVAATTNLHLR